MQPTIIAAVAVSSATYAIDKPFSYRVPESLLLQAIPGARVAVPFGRGNKSVEGIILTVAPGEPTRGLKAIERVLDDTPLLNDEQMKLALWVSSRFFCTVFEAVRAMLPAGVWYRDGKSPKRGKTEKYARLSIPADEAQTLAVQKKARSPKQSAILEFLCDGEAKSVADIVYQTGATAAPLSALLKLGVVEIEEREVFRRPVVELEEPAPQELTEDQAAAYDTLSEDLNAPAARAALLYGVTGSGKTTVYLRLLEQTLAVGRTGIVLVPEIALTPQLMRVFVSRFGDDVAVLHSALSGGERFDEWMRIKNGSVKVVIGTRSAIFAPLENIGLIVIDEEQEHTYKSENAPRYHARDVAKYRCARSRALLVLGSATPSVESMFRAQSGDYRLVRLRNRFNERELPNVIIADLKAELRAGNSGAIGSVLEEELRRNIDAGEQSILFINRRGASQIVSCGECGFTFSCDNCDVSLTYHSANHRLMCHYCGASHETPTVCPDCGGRLKYVGAGTQRVEEELRVKFPQAKILRMDADTVSAANPHSRVLGEFRDGRAHILLGTQMVAKGLDFENVTLVGAVLADLSLFVNDYRANERTFSLITQVVGRSGRGEKPGRAVIQTMTPTHEVICLAAAQDYDAFYAGEIERRDGAALPPVRDLLTVTASGAEEAAVMRGCVIIRDSLMGYLKNEPELDVLGPAPMPVPRVNNRYRYRVTILGANTKNVRAAIAHTIREFAKDGKNRGIAVHADVDPF